MAKVTLLAYTPIPEKIVAAGAKLCYSSSNAEDLLCNLTDEKASSFVNMLAEIGHESPIEHASFTFGIEGVSRSLLAQITRHRLASFSVQSQRYVKIDNFEFITPPQISKIPKAREEYLKAMNQAMEHYVSLYKTLQEHYIDEFKRNNPQKDVSEFKKKAEKMAIEDARYVLPNASATQLMCTMNARSLSHFFNLRCCNRAQWEIRDLATQMLKAVLKVAPDLFKNAGPLCVCGKCPEGKMSCGKQNEVQKYFRDIFAEVQNDT